MATLSTARNLWGMNASTRRRPLAHGHLWPLAALGLVLVGGCTPMAGHRRFQHPALSQEVGRAPVVPGAKTALLDGPAPSTAPAARRLRAQIAQTAAHEVGGRRVVVDGRPYRQDCSGVTRGIYAKAGVPLGGRARSKGENDVSIIYRYVKEHGSIRRANPLPGDLVFFDNTYDRDRDGRINDPLSHIGVVERVLDDGTVIFVHRVGGGILRYRMNLDHPRLARDPATGRRLNHFLRRRGHGAAAATTAELFVGFGTVVMRGEQTAIARR